MCDIGAGYAGPDDQCKFKLSRCTKAAAVDDLGATINPDGSCKCSPGYLSPPGSSGPDATCDRCDVDGGYYNKDRRCVTGTVCQMSVFGANNASALGKPGDASGPKTYAAGDLDIGNTVEYVQLQRTSGSAACTARIKTTGGCDIDVTLPTSKSHITSFPILTKGQSNEANADESDIGRSFESIAIGTQAQVQTGGTPCSDDTFATQATAFVDQCPSAAGNVCAYYYIDPT